MRCGHVSVSEIALSDFDQTQAERLGTWLQYEHVRRWFPDPSDIVEWACAVPENGRQRLILEGGEAIGYLRWTYVPRDVLDAIGFDHLPADSADIDLFIAAESRTGRGIGGRALELAIAELRQERIATLAALTTSVENTMAQKAFKRAGFQIDCEYSPGQFGPCYLMVRDL